jgi:hypothetical protein
MSPIRGNINAVAVVGSGDLSEGRSAQRFQPLSRLSPFTNWECPLWVKSGRTSEPVSWSA